MQQFINSYIYIYLQRKKECRCVIKIELNTKKRVKSKGFYMSVCVIRIISVSGTAFSVLNKGLLEDLDAQEERKSFRLLSQTNQYTFDHLILLSPNEKERRRRPISTSSESFINVSSRECFLSISSLSLIQSRLFILKTKKKDAENRRK